MEAKNEKMTLGKRLKNSVTFKVITTVILILILLIPMGMIKSVIQEREEQRHSAIKEVSNKWAGKQLLNGPILTIPVVYERKIDKEMIPYTKWFHLLPDQYNVNGKVIPKKLRRGIYEIVVYESLIKNKGTFNIPNVDSFTNAKEIQFDKAFITIGISDLKGIKNQLQLEWGKDKLRVTPGTKIKKIISSGITIKLENLEENLGKIIPFNFDLNLQGSQQVSFVPVGKATNVEIESSWNSPSFFGNFLPDYREVNNKGFKSSWNILQLNRNFPQSWFDDENTNLLREAAFGVDLKLPVDDYQKAIRSAKYALLILGLTFLVFFLTEVLNKKRIHPLQYILVGLALCVFYILLISISEHLDFNKAYLIGSVAVISIITMYASSVIKERKIALLIFSILTALYAFVFVILQLVDYVLLIGSIGLILILAITMFCTRKIDWYAIQFDKSQQLN